MKTDSYDLFSSEFLHKYQLVSIEKLTKLNTKRLLNYFKKYKHKKYTFVCGCCGERLYRNDNQKQDDLQIQKYFKVVKEILDEREHIK